VVVVDDRVAVRDALVAGAGAGVLPAFLGEPERARGDLVRVERQPLAAIPVHAVYLPEQRRDPRVRTLIEIVEQHLQPWVHKPDP
jgi:DNA-binding transcriptional LysR family regulator